MVYGVLAIVLGIVALSHTAPFPFLLEAFAGQVSVWRVRLGAGERKVYLTYDDGPNPEATPALLDLLREKNVRATFFLIPGHVTEETAPLVRRMVAEGHTVGQHSADRWLMLRSPARFAAEMDAAADHIERLTGHRPARLFRPHGGWRSVQMMAGARRARYRLTGWSWMSWDWNWFRKRTGARVASQILSHAAPGKIIVMHDGHHVDPRAERGYTVEATRQIIDGLRGRGYEFGTLGEVEP